MADESDRKDRGKESGNQGGTEPCKERIDRDNIYRVLDTLPPPRPPKDKEGDGG